jgi:hypothetical protein
MSAMNQVPTHEDEKSTPCSDTLYPVPCEYSVSWPDLLFHLAETEKKGNMHETNALRFSPLHVLDTIKSALFVTYISGTIFRVSDAL